MNVSFRQLFSFHAILVAAAIVVQPGCWEKQSIAEESTIRWDSPQMVAINKEWDSLWDTFTKTPEKISTGKHPYEELVRMQGELLRKRLSDNDVRHLAASCGTLPTRWREWSKFDRAVVEFMLDVFVHSRDREAFRRCSRHDFHYALAIGPLNTIWRKKEEGTIAF